jgi:hypothetical protein
VSRRNAIRLATLIYTRNIAVRASRTIVTKTLNVTTNVSPVITHNKRSYDSKQNSVSYENRSRRAARRELH